MSVSIAASVNQQTRREAWPGWLVLLCLALWFGALAWARWLTLPDEGRYAGVAWEMLRSGSPMVPLLDGMPYFHKPPLYYWLAQISYALFGVHEFSARLPSLLGAWSAGAALYAFMARYRNAAQARWAVVILGLMPLFFGAAQFANMDMLVASMITLCVLAAADTALRRAAGRPFRAMSVATGVLAALAVLAKGLIGLALPGSIVLAWLVLRRDWPGVRALLWVPALLAFAVVAVPWFWLMELRYPGFNQYFFVYQQFERFSQGGFNNAQPFWFYLPIVAGLALPWSIWGAAIFKPSFWREADPQGLRRLAAIWMAVVIVFFSIPHSKLIGYVLPVFPALALLVSERVAPAWAAGKRRGAWIAVGVSAVLCLTAVIVAATNPRGSAGPVAKELRQEMQPQDIHMALHTLPFDLGFYTQAREPAWIVDDWQNPEIPKRDNWRKELYDAAQFDPVVGKRVLISAEDMRVRMCEAGDGARFWLWGQKEDGDRYPVLHGVAPRLTIEKRVMWRIDVDAAFRQRACAGLPAAPAAAKP
ncbi:Undecaprenyl phosphate-alpha-4-amino-4-deoxy-L-arabinose arabinosyl transferase [Achromobacter anxifer]|uniref:Undecaprenyl phosphate-alpha-4-amino-4-deoxy-L-arabinose arabinosyl transferase n=1 Tax=Achromobacter anxifer TaxID=1287737 RepID=A0A6S7CFY5_9BURK|nr:glycosyltransferase family 39 protein [Achromobacter anxifer]CAB3847315.1 Undecaprenyl phosphate-alpha-4-amino-4-deoxy-L-arabinose arabinosyl transferase [Achromobacter anxifer]